MHSGQIGAWEALDEARERAWTQPPTPLWSCSWLACGSSFEAAGCGRRGVSFTIIPMIHRRSAVGLACARCPPPTAQCVLHTDTSHSTHQSASSASHLGPGAGAPPQPHRAVPETHTHRPRTPRPDEEIVVSDGPRAALRRGQHASAASPRGLDLGMSLDALVRLGLGSIAGQAAERLVAKGVPRPAELRSAGGGRRG